MPSTRRTHVVISLVPGAPTIVAIHDWSSDWSFGAGAGSNGCSPRRWLFVGRSSSCAVAWGSPFGTVQGVKLEVNLLSSALHAASSTLCGQAQYAASDTPVGLLWFVCSQNLQIFRCCERYGCSVSIGCEPAGERAERAREDSRRAGGQGRRCMHANEHAHDCSMLL